MNYNQKANSHKKKLTVPIVLIILLAAVIIAVLAAKPQSVSKAGFAAEGSSHTVMIYMVGSDLETDYNLASGVLKNIESSGIDSAKNNVLVYTGGCEKFSYSESAGNTLYKLNNNKFEILENKETQNMGLADTLSEFVSYGTENYQTDSYELIFWNHGGGPVYGFGKDTNFDYDCLTLKELKEGLSNGLKNSRVKFEMIGFDACLMCNIETAATIKDYARYMVASQETEPGNGWDYSFLKQLNKDKISGDVLGKLIIDSYCEFYKKNYSDKYQITLSCIDLSKVDSLCKEFDKLFNQVQSFGISKKFSSISRSRSNTKSFGTFATNVLYDLVDICELTDNLDSSYTEKNGLKNTLNSLVVYSKSNMKNAKGLSVYFPYKDMVAAKDILNGDELVSFSKSYTKFINEFYYYFNEAEDFEEGLENEGAMVSSTKDKTDFEYLLSEKEYNNFASAKYYIFRKATFVKGDENYCLMCSSNDVELKGRTLYASYKNKTFYACKSKLDFNHSIPVPLFEDESSTKDNRLYTVPIVLQSFSDNISDWKIQSAWLRVKTSDTSDEVTIIDAVPISDDEENNSEVAPKQLLNISDYEVVSFPGFIRQPTRYENGQLKPLSEWKADIGVEGPEIKINKDIYFKKDFITVKGEKYYCVFCIKDIYGKTHMSEFIEMS